MLFNSVQFGIFFIIIFILYYSIKKEWRTYLLLGASYYFYMQWNVKYSLLIMGITGLSYVVGLGIDKYEKRKKVWLASGCIGSILLLIIFKYSNFLIENMNHLFKGNISAIDIILPVGISFYTFQAMGYMIDVYRKDVKVERNICKYALFVSFFPQLVAGPIERSKNLLHQIDRMKEIKCDLDKVYKGLLLMAWGLFEKTIISDRLAIVVDQIYGNYEEYGLLPITIATILFAFQIYCDFDGYTNVARGCSRVLGIELICNFRQPYFAQSIHEFWDRWHVSLSSWFQDYLYIPLGGNRKGKCRKYINVMIVFLVSGLWHGAEWNFLVWGGIHGVINVLEEIFHLGKRKCDSISAKLRNIIVTFGIVDIAWLFFRANDMNHAIALIKQMVSMTGDFTDVLDCLGTAQWNILFWGMLILFVVDFMRYSGKSVYDFLMKQEIWFRYAVYIGIVILLFYFQIYSVSYEPNQFIYFQF